jgi:hypothetical protein
MRLPPPRLWKLTGYGKLRVTTALLPDLPTSVGNPAYHPPARDSHSSHSLGGVDRKTKMAIFL